MRNRVAVACAFLALPLLASCADAPGAGQQTVAAKPTTVTPAGGLTGTGTSGAPATSQAPAQPGPATCPPATGTTTRVTEFTAAPPMCINPAKTYTAVLTTDAGPITIALDPKAAPKTVNNFVVLARHHYYDGVLFHRVVKGFVIQGGDPDGTGAGGPGYTFADELPKAGAYQVGTVAMANAGPNTNGSQFFIVTGAQAAGLPPAYSVFGKVTSGMEAVTKIETDGSPTGGQPVLHTITGVTISES